MLCEEASLPGSLVYLWFGVLSETGKHSPSPLQRAGWKREKQRRGRLSKPGELMKKARGSAHPRLLMLLLLPHPLDEMATRSLSSPLLPESGSPASLAQGPSAPLDPRAGEDEMAAWAAAHRDGFQALKWAEIDERPQEGHFFLNFGARRSRCQGPQPAGLAFPPWSPGTASVLTVQTSGGHQGRTQGWGGVGGCWAFPWV